MRVRFLSSLAIVIAAVSLVSVRVASQTPTVVKTVTLAKSWAPPKTADGQPDIQGMWVNYDNTPFETPNPADKRQPAAANDGTGPSADFADSAPPRNSKRRSMVVDPPNGRVPVMAWAEAKRDFNIAHIQDSWEYQTPWERCITRGVPAGIFPPGYGAGYQIVQGPGTVGILYEMIHEARIIPVDGSPHLPKSIRLWNGDSRGHWEGNTLVVDIANYNDKGNIATNVATGRMRAIPQSEELHVVERFTVVDPKTMNYEVTIEDPKVYTAPWKVAMPLIKDDKYQIFEYACHEGNNAMPDTLSAGRAGDNATAQAARQKK
jgi:hypothetical protein